MPPHPPRSTLFPYTTLFRSWISNCCPNRSTNSIFVPSSYIDNFQRTYFWNCLRNCERNDDLYFFERFSSKYVLQTRSEEHTSELQSPVHLVFRLLLEKKKYA